MNNRAAMCNFPMSFIRTLKALAVFTVLIALCHSVPALSAPKSREALYYVKLGDKTVQCRLCPRNCVIPDKKKGFCNARENKDGILYSLVYAYPVALHVDPIEKKPLFHFYPSTTAFSIATAGCNLRCKFCQNWEISQAKPEDIRTEYVEPGEVVARAKASGAPSIAYTYTEPTIFYEYMLDIAQAAKKEGIRNIMHSCGYINEEPLRALAKYLDAANIDLKGFSEEFYAKMTDSTLEPVLKSLKILKEEGVHLEITNLIVPGYNDDPELIRAMCLWIKENLGEDTPLHFSRFFPMFKLLNLNPTPAASLERARAVAVESGLKYVYVGNLPGYPWENTTCPCCGKLLVERKGYFVMQNHVNGGKCEYCGCAIAGKWSGEKK